MVQLKLLSGKKAGAELSFDRFPISIGRLPSADLSADEPGVWDHHCEIVWPPNDGLYLQAQPNAASRVNGENVENCLLRNGDLISVGALNIRFGFTSMRQRSLLVRELLTWVGLAALCLGQIALIYWLIR
jgi:pSer/pThr/pTyr-binding forkhead associated (FHA) protein